jgi:hypothetical protein
MTTVTLMGAGGKMGRRITRNLRDMPEYDLLYVEVDETAVAELESEGIEVTPQDEALAQADVVILALPDRLLGQVTAEIAPKVDSGTMLVCLDPAAAYAGVLAERDDISYFLAHPCHPPLFGGETDPQAQEDWFGGQQKAKQNIVCALHHGPEEEYARGEALARAMYAPVMRAHRVTTEQMAILEPALVETLTATCLYTIREGMDEAVSMGVPEEAARDFLLGHLRIELAIIFDKAGFPFSDSALLAVRKARERIFRSDWKQVMALENVKKSVREIVSG